MSIFKGVQRTGDVRTLLRIAADLSPLDGPYAPRPQIGIDLAIPIGHARRMATDKNTAAFIVDQLSATGEVTARPMFGEYGLYCDGKMFGMICNGRLFI